MKVRTGFVSNSSSSSFVICRALLTDEQDYGLIEYFKKKMEECREKYRSDYREEPNDSDITFGERGNWEKWNNYIKADVYYLDDFWQKIKELGIDEDMYIVSEY